MPDSGFNVKKGEGGSSFQMFSSGANSNTKHLAAWCVPRSCNRRVHCEEQVCQGAPWWDVFMIARLPRETSSLSLPELFQSLHTNNSRSPTQAVFQPHLDSSLVQQESLPHQLGGAQPASSFQGSSCSTEEVKPQSQDKTQLSVTDFYQETRTAISVRCFQTYSVVDVVTCGHI